MSTIALELRTGQLDHPAVIGLLHAHLGALARLTPIDRMHALDLERLKAPDITFWTAWSGGAAVGCAALRELDARHGEVKSMRTAPQHLRRGVAAALLAHLLDAAMQRGYERLSLETGTAVEFEPAHRLYARFGFERCGPFGQYRDDPYSMFMTRRL